MLIERQLKDDSMCTVKHVAEKMQQFRSTQRVSKLKTMRLLADLPCLCFRKEGYSTNLPVPVLVCKLIPHV